MCALLIQLLGPLVSRADALEELLAHPEHSASYYYNAGTLLGRAARWEEARAYFEVAHYLDPFDAAIRGNWQIALTHTSVTPELIFMDRLWIWMFHPGFVAILCVAALLILIWAVRRKQTVGTLFAAVLCFSVGALIELSSRVPGAVLNQSLMVRSGPDASFLDLGSLPAGTWVRILDAREGWFQVRYRDREVGWVPQANCLLFSRNSIKR